MISLAPEDRGYTAQGYWQPVLLRQTLCGRTALYFPLPGKTRQAMNPDEKSLSLVLCSGGVFNTLLLAFRFLRLEHRLVSSKSCIKVVISTTSVARKPPLAGIQQSSFSVAGFPCATASYSAAAVSVI